MTSHHFWSSLWLSKFSPHSQGEDDGKCGYRKQGSGCLSSPLPNQPGASALFSGVTAPPVFSSDHISQHLNLVWLLFALGPHLTSPSFLWIQEGIPGASLVVQWLRLHALNAGGSGSTPGCGTRARMLQLNIPLATVKTEDPPVTNRGPEQTNK